GDGSVETVRSLLPLASPSRKGRVVMLGREPLLQEGDHPLCRFLCRLTVPVDEVNSQNAMRLRCRRFRVCRFIINLDPLKALTQLASKGLELLQRAHEIALETEAEHLVAFCAACFYAGKFFG